MFPFKDMAIGWLQDMFEFDQNPRQARAKSEAGSSDERIALDRWEDEGGRAPRRDRFDWLER